MEDSRWLKLMTIGLVLAAIAVGYFLFSGRFASNSSKQQSNSSASPSASLAASASSSPSTSPSVLGQTTQTGSRSRSTSISGSTSTSGSPSPTPASAFNRIVSRNQGNQISQANQEGGSSVTTLPRTGFPIVSVVAFSLSALISGWGLRRFPH